MRRTDMPAPARHASLGSMPEDESMSEIDLSSLPRRGRRNAVVHFEFALDGSAIGALTEMPGSSGAFSPNPSVAAAAAAATSPAEEEEEDEMAARRSRRNAFVSFELSSNGTLATACSQLQVSVSVSGWVRV